MLCAVIILAGCQSEESSTAERESAAMAEQHAGDQPDPTQLVVEPRIPVSATTVDYGAVDGATVTGYLAVPARPDSVAQAMGQVGTTLPAVILVHEWWGLNDNIRAMARRLAGEGFRVLAVDLYGQQVAETPDAARQYMQEAMEDEAQLLDNMQAAYSYLVDTYEASQVGVVGWCFGGTITLRAAVAMPQQLDAAVIYYGNVAMVGEDELAALEMPVLAFFGEEDASIPMRNVDAFEATLDALDIQADVYTYEGAGHAFANPSGRNYVPEAAEDAWEKTTRFLTDTLYGLSGDAL